MKRTWIYRLAGGLVALITVTLATWVAIAGPITVSRIIRYGDTDIDDFTHYPGRQLSPSEAPFHFEGSRAELEVPPEILNEYGGVDDLGGILVANDTIAFLIIREDKILYERYFQGHARGDLSQAFSMAKSFTSALIGMAIDDGYIAGVDQPVTDFIPELAPEGFTQVTIHHLLTMTSGSSYVENDNPFGAHVILNYTPRLEAEIVGFELERDPGEIFRYKSGDNALLALVLDRALGQETLTAYTQRRLWTPLGMQDEGVWSIDHQGDGLEKTWCCLAASARDFAKLGALYLKHGDWNGQELLPASWIERSTEGHIPESTWPPEYPAAGWHNYGYQWWLASEQIGDYFALGKDGQFLYISPEKELVIVRLGWSSGDLLSSQWISLFQHISAILE